MAEIQYRWMSPDEVGKVSHIDRTERIRTGYRVRDGQLKEMDVKWDSPPWMLEGKGDHTIAAQIDFCRKHLVKGAWMYGAFEGLKLVGIGVLTPDIQPRMDQLAFLHVSHSYRRLGIGYSIASALQEKARARGAVQLYVSATPSGSAVGFYLDFGFELVDEPVPELFELEPDDIHMVKILTYQDGRVPNGYRV